MKAAFGGYGGKLVIFGATEGVLAGVPVMMSASRAIAPYAVGKVFCSIVVNVRDGFAAVQLAGHVWLPYTDMAPAVGYQMFVGGGVGKIRTDTAGQQPLVVDVDISAAVCDMILQRKRKRTHGFL